MPQYSEQSKQKLEQAHEDLQKVFNEVIKHFDCTILKGYRGEKEQNDAYKKGNSKLKYPRSKHNKIPSLAVDVAPYPINWGDTNRMRYFAGFVVGIGKSMGIDIRWGGDWDKDTELKDNKFNDLVHFEVVE